MQTFTVQYVQHFTLEHLPANLPTITEKRSEGGRLAGWQRRHIQIELKQQICRENSIRLISSKSNCQDVYLLLTRKPNTLLPSLPVYGTFRSQPQIIQRKRFPLDNPPPPLPPLSGCCSFTRLPSALNRVERECAELKPRETSLPDMSLGGMDIYFL